MKPVKYIFLFISIIMCWSCHWPDPPEYPVLVKEDAVFKFYNNGDPTLDKMSMYVRLYYPVEDQIGGGDECKEKTITSFFCGVLHPYDSITGSIRDSYIGCIRYAEFTVYYEDTTSSDGYRLRGQYVVNDTIKQKYADHEYKYPDKTTIIVNWPEDSLLFK